MKARTLIPLLVTALIVVFAILNWEAINTATPLSLGVVSFVAPIGLILLGLLAVVSAFYFSYTAWLRHCARRDAREQAQKLEAQRALAEEAEASRFTQLREFLSTEVRQQREREERRQADILERLERLEMATRRPSGPVGDGSAPVVARADPVLARQP